MHVKILQKSDFVEKSEPANSIKEINNVTPTIDVNNYV